MGREFEDNALAIDADREGVRLTGYRRPADLNRPTRPHQYLFVNGRPVRDRLLAGALRGAYADFLARDRHPMAALFLEAPTELVDVNVHPAKAEVRFRDAGLVRGLIVGALRTALAAAGHRASTTVADAALGALPAAHAAIRRRCPRAWRRRLRLVDPARPGRGGDAVHGAARRAVGPHRSAAEPANGDGVAYPLGVARAQLHETYIVAQTDDGVVIVDQHAAHERLLLRALKHQLEAEGVERQALLLPEVVDVGEDGARRLAQRAAELADMGLVLEPFGLGAVVVRETPALLGEADVQGLVRDLADELAEMGDHLSLKEKVEEVCGTLACHTSVRAGRRLDRRGDERAAAPDGGDAAFRPVQSRPPDLCRAQAGRHRAAVRKTMNKLLTFCLALAVAGAARLPRRRRRSTAMARPQRRRLVQRAARLRHRHRIGHRRRQRLRQPPPRSRAQHQEERRRRRRRPACGRSTAWPSPAPSR